MYRNPLCDKRSTHSSHDDTISPQALLEQKHAIKSSSCPATIPQLGPQFNILRALAIAYHAPASGPVGLPKAGDRDPTECSTLTADDLGLRLGQMIADAFKSNDSILDEEKIMGCLEGRLELQVVERAPPPYRAPSSLEHLTRQFSRIKIVEPSLA